MSKCPYSFPARSRAAMIQAIQDIANPRYYDHHRWPFTWDVKWPYLPDANSAEVLGAAYQSEFTPAWDSDFQAEMETEGFFGAVTESMWSQMESYSTYPGDDSGEWEFALMGRSGGWLVLVNGPVYRFADFDPDELADAEQYSFADIRALYRALIVMDHDFSRDKVRAEFLYQIGFQREQWEEARRAEIARLEAWEATQRAAYLALRREIRETVAPCDIAGAPAMSAALCAAVRERAAEWRDARSQLAELRP